MSAMRRKRKSGYTDVSLRIPRDIVVRLVHVAERADVSVSVVVSVLLSMYVDTVQEQMRP